MSRRLIRWYEAEGQLYMDCGGMPLKIDRKEFPDDDNVIIDFSDGSRLWWGPETMNNEVQCAVIHGAKD